MEIQRHLWGWRVRLTWIWILHFHISSEPLCFLGRGAQDDEEHPPALRAQPGPAASDDPPVLTLCPNENRDVQPKLKHDHKLEFYWGKKQDGGDFRDTGFLNVNIISCVKKTKSPITSPFVPFVCSGVKVAGSYRVKAGNILDRPPVHHSLI